MRDDGAGKSVCGPQLQGNGFVGAVCGGEFFLLFNDGFSRKGALNVGGGVLDVLLPPGTDRGDAAGTEAEIIFAGPVSGVVDRFAAGLDAEVETLRAGATYSL